jgi:hypothetical protein
MAARAQNHTSHFVARSAYIYTIILFMNFEPTSFAVGIFLGACVGRAITQHPNDIRKDVKIAFDVMDICIKRISKPLCFIIFFPLSLFLWL